MALLRTEFPIAATPADAWAVIRDFAAGPLRMAPGFVVGCEADGDVRVVTFADGVVAHERFVALDDRERRITYAVVGGSVRPDQDTAEMRVVPADGGCRLIWTHDVRPDELGPAFQAAMDRGAKVIKRTLEGGGAGLTGAPRSAP
ncbi:SRPBCC family protein [Pseudonocardia zijingensis]